MTRRGNAPSRGHHFIPRFHLRGFTPTTGPKRLSIAADRLARFDKSTGQIDHPSVARSAVINDYHTLPAATGREPTELEDILTNLETIVAPWIWHLRSVEVSGRLPIEPIIRDGLAGYVATLYVRSPVFREGNQKLETFLESIRIDMLLANPTRVLGPSARRR